MRLQKQKTREVKGKEYFRWTVVIPPEEVKELGWKEGDELESKPDADERLVIRKARK
jgi:bifunctional DNA-binding transcriptional regulator/antitoxin component of YhaV-PrlF toxin-antitoxin module